MLQQARSLRRHLPLRGRGQGTPSIHIAPNLINDRGLIVFLILSGQPLAFVKDDLDLSGGLFALFWFRDRREKFGAAPAIQCPLGRLAMFVQFPVPRGNLVRRVQDRMIEERIRHAASVHIP